MIRKIKISSLRSGMYVHGLLRSSGEPCLLDSVHIITNNEEIDLYARDDFQYAYIHSDDEAMTDKKDIPDPVGFYEEIESARRIKRAARDVVRNYMRHLAAGTSIDTSMAEIVVDSMVDSVFRNKDALLSLSRLKDYDNYTFSHSINVCILSLTFAKHLGYPKKDIHILGLGALLHDVGKICIPEDILNKPGALTDNEFEEVKKHVTEGVDLLRNASGIKDEIIDIICQHHERYDGSGYPCGLKNDNIHPYAKIVAISDVYDAMTSKRPYRHRLSPSTVLRDIFTLKGSHFAPDTVENFILCLGIYPIGTLVKLNTGETAIVKSINQSDLLKPVVDVFLNREGKRYDKPFEADFSNNTERKVVAVIDSVELSDQVL